MPVRSVAFLALCTFPVAFAAGCDAQTKCAPTCMQASLGGGTGLGQGGSAGANTGGGGAGGAPQAGTGGLGGATGAGGAAASCPPPASTVCVQPAPSFAADIAPILDRSCNGCHTVDNPDGVWPLNSWADVAAWSNLIIPDLVQCRMPPPDSTTPFPEADRQLFFAWLACNSPNN